MSERSAAWVVALVIVVAIILMSLYPTGQRPDVGPGTPTRDPQTQQDEYEDWINSQETR